MNTKFFNYLQACLLGSESFDFERFRLLFNKTFKLCVNSHYAGLGRINDLFTFMRRLYKALTCRYSGYNRRGYLVERYKFRLGHQKISVYAF